MPPKRAKKPRTINVKTSDHESNLESSSKRSKTTSDENDSPIITRSRRKRPDGSTSSSVVSEPSSSRESISTQDTGQNEEEQSQDVAIVPSHDQFAEALSRESDWYSLGVFLRVPTPELNSISTSYRDVGHMRCVVELYTRLIRSCGQAPSWDDIVSSLRRMGSHDVANAIISRYITPRLQVAGSTAGSKTGPNVTAIALPPFQHNDKELPPDINAQYALQKKRFLLINYHIKNAFVKAEVDVEDLQHFIHQMCYLSPLQEATTAVVLRRLENNISFFDLDIMEFLVESLLPDNLSLLTELAEFRKAVEEFKTYAKIKDIAGRTELVRYASDNSEIVQLKTRMFWGNATIKKFENATDMLLPIEYHHKSQLSVESGCFIISWIISNVCISSGLPKHSLEFLKIIGVITLHIGEDIIYDLTNEPGCEVLEAAMMQAVELKNAQAIEFLLAMGCSPEVATNTGDNAVTSIVNIRERSSANDGSVHHICVLGHSEHVEAIVDPSSEPQCSSCGMKDKMIKQLHRSLSGKKSAVIEELVEKQINEDEEVKSKESDSSKSGEDAHYDYEELVEKLKERDQEIEMLREMAADAKIKDAENDLLVKENRTLIKESKERGFFFVC